MSPHENKIVDVKFTSGMHGYVAISLDEGACLWIKNCQILCMYSRGVWVSLFNRLLYLGKAIKPFKAFGQTYIKKLISFLWDGNKLIA